MRVCAGYELQLAEKLLLPLLFPIAVTSHTSTTDPAGLCLNDTVCATTNQQCDIMNKTQVLRCSGGLDSSSSYGRCIAKPPPPPVLTPCERCLRCLTAARVSVAAAVNASAATPTSLASSFYSWCSSRGSALSVCRAVQTAVSGSLNGNLARRTGALCQRLEECPASVASDSTCGLSVTAVGNSNSSGPVTGRLDMCTVEGVSGGQQVAGLSEFNGQVAGVMGCNAITPSAFCLQKRESYTRSSSNRCVWSAHPGDGST